MHSHYPQSQSDRPGNYYAYYAKENLLACLQQPSVIIPLVLLFFTVFYQYLHSSPFNRPRHPGELLWDFIVTITPANLLYALNNWLHPSILQAQTPVPSTRSRTYTAKSELLAKILGMDGTGGIITSVADAGMRSLSSLSSGTLLKQNTDQPPGLRNYDNSCFQNSILQGLASLEPFPSFLARGLRLGEPEGDVESGSISSLHDLISKLTDPNNNGKTLWTPKKLKSLDTGQQQDAQEYFSKILDEVEKEMIKAAKPQHLSVGFETVGVRDDTEDSQHSDDSGYQSLPVLSKAASEARVLRNPLEGLAAQRVACVSCGHSDGLSLIPFNCLTLSLGLSEAGHDLYERMDSYTDLETIEGVECAKCTLLEHRNTLRKIIASQQNGTAPNAQLQNFISRLQSIELALEDDNFDDRTLEEKCEIRKRCSSSKTKQVAIARPPQSLAIHMNRSVFDENTGFMFKNLSAVRFPKNFDLGPWCLGSAGGPVNTDSDASSDISADEEQWITDPESSMVAGDLKPSRISGPLYELRAVVTHQGRHEDGHYVCYRKHPYQPSKLKDTSSKNFETFDDADISMDDESTLVDRDVDSDADSKWWRLSDESVWEVSEETVLAQGGVFMLFYDCIDPNSVLVSATQHDGKEDGTTAYYDDVWKDSSSDKAKLQGLPQTNPLSNGIPDNDDLETDKHNLYEAKPVGSVLMPSLADGEKVDPVIPLHRPNS
ncbi:hypothetical protein M426DRAFT_319562 [Hypoxylon sp. CI-4A]|nr:hypothetical protein M426DRAFT_319562 [Hypoxylon sp. CI-4A]